VLQSLSSGLPFRTKNLSVIIAFLLKYKSKTIFLIILKTALGLLNKRMNKAQ
jgi:hypothetical protein